MHNQNPMLHPQYSQFTPTPNGYQYNQHGYTNGGQYSYQSSVSRYAQPAMDILQFGLNRVSDYVGKNRMQQQGSYGGGYGGHNSFGGHNSYGGGPPFGQPNGYPNQQGAFGFRGKFLVAYNGIDERLREKI